MFDLTLNKHDSPLAWAAEFMPFLHLNARSRYITSEEIEEIYLEEISR